MMASAAMIIWSIPPEGHIGLINVMNVFAEGETYQYSDGEQTFWYRKVIDTEKSENSFVEIVQYEGRVSAVTIPDTIDDLPVRFINPESFNRDYILSLTLPESFTGLIDGSRYIYSEDFSHYTERLRYLMQIRSKNNGSAMKLAQALDVAFWNVCDAEGEIYSYLHYVTVDRNGYDENGNCYPEYSHLNLEDDSEVQKYVCITGVDNNTSVENYTIPLEINETKVAAVDIKNDCSNHMLIIEGADTYILSSGLSTVCGYSGSTAETICLRRMIPFILLNEESDSDYSFSMVSNGVSVEIKSDAEKLIIPDTWNGHQVTKISVNSNAPNLKSLVLPKTVEGFSGGDYDHGYTGILNMSSKFPLLNNVFGCKGDFLNTFVQSVNGSGWNADHCNVDSWNSIFEYSELESGVSVERYNNAFMNDFSHIKNVVIPERIDGKQITELNLGSWYNIEGIESVVVNADLSNCKANGLQQLKQQNNVNVNFMSNDGVYEEATNLNIINDREKYQLKYALFNDHAEIIGLPAYSTSDVLTIPAYINGVKVTKIDIDDNDTYYHSSLWKNQPYNYSSLLIPDTIESENTDLGYIGITYYHVEDDWPFTYESSSERNGLKLNLDVDLRRENSSVGFIDFGDNDVSDYVKNALVYEDSDYYSEQHPVAIEFPLENDGVSIKEIDVSLEVYQDDKIEMFIPESVEEIDLSLMIHHPYSNDRFECNESEYSHFLRRCISVIRGYTGSYAQSYADEYGIRFEAVDGGISGYATCVYRDPDSGRYYLNRSSSSRNVFIPEGISGELVIPYDGLETITVLDPLTMLSFDENDYPSERPGECSIKYMIGHQNSEAEQFARDYNIRFLDIEQLVNSNSLLAKDYGSQTDWYIWNGNYSNFDNSVHVAAIPYIPGYDDYYVFSRFGGIREGLYELTIPPSVEDVPYDLLDICPDLKLIKGVAGSSAETLAREYQISFKAVDIDYTFLQYSQSSSEFIDFLKEQNCNTFDAGNARSISEAVLEAVAAEGRSDYFTTNPWQLGGGLVENDHGYVYVDQNEVRVSSYKLAELLEEQGFITSASQFTIGHRASLVEDGIEIAAEYVYRKPVCSSLLCKSKETWYRYQINIMYRDGAIKFTYSAVSKDGEMPNDTDMSSKTNTIDRGASQKFAVAVGIGEADLYTSLGPPSTPDDAHNDSNSQHSHVNTVTSWIWNDDHTSCTANLKCSRCGDESTVVITDITHEHANPTATQDGYDQYTASVEIDGQTYSDTADIPISADDIKAVNAMILNVIKGNVEGELGEAIEETRAAYDALPDLQKGCIDADNYSIFAVIERLYLDNRKLKSDSDEAIQNLNKQLEDALKAADEAKQKAADAQNAKTQAETELQNVRQDLEQAAADKADAESKLSQALADKNAAAAEAEQALKDKNTAEEKALQAEKAKAEAEEIARLAQAEKEAAKMNADQATAGKEVAEAKAAKALADKEAAEKYAEEQRIAAESAQAKYEEQKELADKAAKEAAEVEKALEDANNAIEELEGSLEDVSGALETALNESEEAKSALDEAETMIGKLTEEKENAEESASQAADKLDELTQENDDLKEKIDSLTDDNNSLQTENEQLGKDNEALQTENEQLGKDNEALQSENEKLISDNEQLQNEADKLTADNEALRAEIERLNAEIEALKAEIARLRAEIDALKAEIAGLNAEIEALRAENESLKAENAVLKAENEEIFMSDKAVEAALKEARNDLDKANKELDKAEKEKAKAEEKLRKAEQNHSDSEDKLNKARADLEEAEARLINATAGKEAAEARISELLDIIEKQDSTARQALADKKAAESRARQAEADLADAEARANQAEANKEAAEARAEQAEADKAAAEARAEKAEAEKATAEAIAEKVLEEKETEKSVLDQIRAEIESAEAVLDELKSENESLAEENAALKAEADMVSGLIGDIGTVELTDECRNSILAARKAYDGLTYGQKTLVPNSYDLVLAEETYKSLAEAAYDVHEDDNTVTDEKTTDNDDGSVDNETEDPISDQPAPSEEITSETISDQNDGTEDPFAEVPNESVSEQNPESENASNPISEASSDITADLEAVIAENLPQTGVTGSRAIYVFALLMIGAGAYMMKKSREE